MTSLPHASGWPHRQPQIPPDGKLASQPASLSGSRQKDSFPPPPKSVRFWQVQAQSQDEPDPTVASPAEVQPLSQPVSQPVLNPDARNQGRTKLGWVFLFLAGFLGLAAWLFVSQLR